MGIGIHIQFWLIFWKRKVIRFVSWRLLSFLFRSDKNQIFNLQFHFSFCWLRPRWLLLACSRRPFRLLLLNIKIKIIIWQKSGFFKLIVKPYIHFFSLLLGKKVSHSPRFSLLLYIFSFFQFLFKRLHLLSLRYDLFKLSFLLLQFLLPLC